MARKKAADPEKNLLDDGVDLKEQILVLEGEVNDELSLFVRRAIRMFDPSKDMTILMNSPGGEVQAGLAIYDTLKLYPSNVTIRVEGEACSVAAVILQAADNRVALKHSIIMTHIGSGGLSENHSTNIESGVAYQKTLGVFMQNILAARMKEKDPKVTPAKVKRFLEFDKWMTTEEAIQLGLLDSVVED